MLNCTHAWPTLTPLGTFLWSVVAMVAFLAAYEVSLLTSTILLYVFALVQLTRAPSIRAAFLAGLAVGYAVFAVELWFLVSIFGPFALLLFLVGAFWTAAFVALGRTMVMEFGSRAVLVFLPMLWFALEYTRSELYWLRFSWLIPGYVFAGNDRPVLVAFTGVYGVGFALTFVSVLAWQLRRRWAIPAGIVAFAAFAAYVEFGGKSRSASSYKENWPNCATIAGVQLEFPSADRVIAALDRVVADNANVELIVLSEYTFSAPVPDAVRAWCRRNERYLVVGGTAPVEGVERAFYNTAFVVGPNGEIVFSQAKSVPIQFFRDGLPAPSQEVWNSPWGKIGICVCFDLSFSRVTDELIRQGAELLIVPTMDVASWGERQHAIHAMVAPSRAAEYGVPIVRVCSSGISQDVDSTGRVRQSLPFPGQGESFTTDVVLSGNRGVPPDRSLAWLGIWTSVASLATVLFRRCFRRVTKPQVP